MKYVLLTSIMVALLVERCAEKPREKIFIKSVKISNDIRVDWYVHSSISNYSPDYLQINSKDTKPFFISFFMSDLNFKNDSLFISLWSDGYEKLDKSVLQGVNVAIDTTGKQWNDAISRLARLKKVGVDISAPHYTDVSCLAGECY